MAATLLAWLPPEAAKILLVLFLSFLIGLEREERKAGASHYAFGGVRTFPLIGLLGYSVGLLSGDQVLPLALGLVVVAAFLLVSYRHKLLSSDQAGMTSEMSGLATYLVGALVQREHFWIATTLAVASALLLELKAALEGLARRMPREEILTFTKFLLITAVILPVLPDRDIGPFQINPSRTWLVVVAVSAVSYGSYVLQKLTAGQGGVLLSAVLGGAYSSTVTTVVLARTASHDGESRLFSGAILIASGMMYLRLALLLWIFNQGLMIALAPSFCVLAGVAAGVGWLWSRRATSSAPGGLEAKNPLELSAALLFALLFLAMLIGTRLAVSYLGKTGVYTLAALMGVTDVDPFVMGLTQMAGTATPLPLASASIVIAAASNNVVKGAYAYGLSGRGPAGVQSLWLLLGLAALGLVPLLW
jgi:uncharacterized membrane protein (DUF4010 family)